MITENLRISFGALAANKLRTVLSVLGIMIGVLSVVLLLAMGSGAQTFVKKQIDAFGTNTVFLFPKGANGSGGTLSRVPQITATDVARLLDGSAPAIELAAPEVYMPLPTVSSDGRTFLPRNVVGVDEHWATVSARRTQSGVLISKSDVVRRGKVAVVGVTVAKRLYGSANAVGERIRVGAQDFEIVGVYRRLGAGIDGDNDSVVHRDLAARWRHRRDEHHVGDRDRTYP